MECDDEIFEKLLTADEARRISTANSEQLNKEHRAENDREILSEIEEAICDGFTRVCIDSPIMKHSNLKDILPELGYEITQDNKYYIVSWERTGADVQTGNHSQERS